MLATKVEEAKREEGFTLIELLVVVIIIGILAAIAIPVFLNQRERAWIRSAESDVRNAAIEVESYFNDDFEYPTGIVTEGTPGETEVLVQSSPGISLAYSVEGQAYELFACHANVEDSCEGFDGTGDNVTASYDSEAGGLQ